MDKTARISAGRSGVHQRGGLMDKSAGISAGRSGVHQRCGLMDKSAGISAGRSGVHQRCGLMDKTLGIRAVRSRFRIPGRGKSSLRTIAVDARVKYLLYILLANAWLKKLSNVSPDLVGPGRIRLGQLKK